MEGSVILKVSLIAKKTDSLQWNPFFLLASAFFPAASIILRGSVFIFSLFLHAFKRVGNDAFERET
jgi:hypothetical protein